MASALAKLWYFSYLCLFTNLCVMKNTVLRVILRIILWAAGIWAILLLIMQVALSPSVLSRVIDKFADEYIDGELKFEKVNVNMFRHFPNLGIMMKNGSLTYPAERYDSLEAKSVQGLLMYHGCGETADTLASFRHFSIGIDIPSLIAGRIKIPHLLMIKPRIFAHAYNDENANWNIFKITEDTDTSSTETAAGPARLPDISLGRIRMTNHPHIVYTDSRDTLFTIIDVSRISFNGKIDTRKVSKAEIGLSVDSMMVAGRLAADTIGLRLDHLRIHEHEDHMDIDAAAKTLLATRSFGRMFIPISITGTAEMPKDTVPAIAMHGFKAEIAAIPIDFDLTLRKFDEGLDVDGRFDIRGCRAEDIINGFVKNIIPASKDIRTDAVLSLSGTCSGMLGNGRIPSINASLTVPESTISHKDIKHDIHLGLGAGIKTDSRQRMNVTVDKAALKTCGLDLEAKAGISDVLGNDPLIHIDGNLKAIADSLLTFLPEDSGITAQGGLTAELNGDLRLSQMDIYNFGKADINGHISSPSLLVKSPKDTIDIDIKELDITIAPETKISKRDNSVHKLLAVSGKIAKAGIALQEALKADIQNLDFAAKSSVDALAEKDAKIIHPIGGHLNADKLLIKDSEGMSVRLSETRNSFQMLPKKGRSDIPVLTLGSTNKRIYIRSESNRAILTDAKLRVGTVMNSIERREKRRAYMDSLASAHPEIPRDSLWSFLRSRRQTQPIPEWMKESDFKSGDINFSLDGMVADYFRKWDINGGIDVRTGILMTPQLPLKNLIRGMNIKFNNNEVRVDSLKLVSGSSEIKAKGSLTGLRRALLGRGIYNLDMVLSTENMDATELLAAFNAGTANVTKADKEALEGASDEEFLKMVTADSLDTKSVSTLLIVPADLNANLKIDAGNIRFSDLLIDELKADIVMKERCMQIVNSAALTNMGTALFEGFYATRSKKDIKTGFNLSMMDITSEKVIAMMPAIDTIMPLLKSFQGQLDCELAATADLDTDMNIVLPSINGVMRIEGEDLTVSDNAMFTNLARKLKFNNPKKAKIDNMMVEGLIRNNTFEVFPFILELDRYTLALSGIQHLDMSYRYHASIIHSPILFKVGVDVYGPDFDNMSFKIGKPKYKNTNVPVFTAVIDQTRINLANSIKNIFEKGVEIAIKENEKQDAIQGMMNKIGYVNAALQKIEELNAQEKQQLEERAIEAPVQTDSTSTANIIEENRQ